MSPDGWILRFREPPAVTVDASPLLPERLCGTGEREVAAIPLQYGRARVALGDLCVLSVGPPQTLVIEGSNHKVRGIGRKASRGTLIVDGDAGDLVGEGLCGARIEVRGSVGDRLASGMQAGVIEVSGAAGDFACAALPGGESTAGGIVRIGGRTGARAGDRMRRGVLVCEGGAGALTGAFMLGGTIVVRGDLGRDPGFAMRRGSLIALDAPTEAPATFRDDGAHEFLWLALLERHLRETAGLDLCLPRRLRRFSGCASVGGRGELLFVSH
ncbi:Formyltransferase/hydrolase complex Fhc subunit C [bacterium HR40]|nr:Formyltransferase/hydrolase complex Fhc subunit C [bacterium HR40]